MGYKGEGVTIKGNSDSVVGACGLRSLAWPGPSGVLGMGLRKELQEVMKAKAGHQSVENKGKGSFKEREII